MQRFMFGDSLFSPFSTVMEYQRKDGKWCADVGYFSDRWTIEQDLNMSNLELDYSCESYFLLYPDYYSKYEHPYLRDTYENEVVYRDQEEWGSHYEIDTTKYKRIQIVWDDIVPFFTPHDNATYFIETMERVRLFYKSELNLTLEFDIFYVKDEGITRCPENPIYIQEAMEEMLIRHPVARLYRGAGTLFIYGCNDILNNVTTVSSGKFSLVKMEQSDTFWVLLVHAVGHLLGATEAPFYDHDSVMNLHKMGTALLGDKSKKEILEHKKGIRCNTKAYK